MEKKHFEKIAKASGFLHDTDLIQVKHYRCQKTKKTYI